MVDLHAICSDQHLAHQGEAVQTAHSHALATSVLPEYVLLDWINAWLQLKHRSDPEISSRGISDEVIVLFSQGNFLPRTWLTILSLNSRSFQCSTK